MRLPSPHVYYPIRPGRQVITLRVNPLGMAPIKLPNPLFEVTNTGRICLLHSGLQVALSYKIAAEMGRRRRAVYVSVARNEVFRQSAQKLSLYVGVGSGSGVVKP